MVAVDANHVDAAWYVQVAEADAGGRVALFVEAVDRLPDSSILEASELIEQLTAVVTRATGTAGRH
jgi:hypothetical protein